MAAPRFMRFVAVSTCFTLALVPAFSVSAEAKTSKEVKCKPNGYWTLKLKSISGTCGGIDPINSHLDLLVTPSREQQKREDSNAEYGYTEHDIIPEAEIKKSILLNRTCIVSMDIWPNQVEPYEEEYDMTVVETGGKVSGVGTLYIRSASDSPVCIQQFLVTGTRSTQIAKVKKPLG